MSRWPDGPVRVPARSCDGCVFGYAPIDRDAGYVACPALPAPAACRRFLELYSTWQLRMITLLWGFAEIELTPARERRGRHARLLRD